MNHVQSRLDRTPESAYYIRGVVVGLATWTLRIVGLGWGVPLFRCQPTRHDEKRGKLEGPTVF